jgi:hypothetical protein
MAEKIIAEPVATQLGCVLSSISQNADALEHLICECVQQTMADGNDVLPRLLIAMQSIVQHIGLTSDIGLERLGDTGGGMKGGAENWVMPPVYHSATRGVEASHV